MVHNKTANDFPRSWLSKSITGGKKIGILNPGYGIEKVSYGLGNKDYNFVKMNKVPVQRVLKSNNVLNQCPFIIGRHVDVLHSFNLLPLNRNFILSYETELPRFLGSPSYQALDFGYKILQSDRCKGIYSLSEAGKFFAQRRMLDRGLTDLANKIQVFRGGFHIRNDNASLRPTSGPIKACFVGGQMFHKGIEATIEALRVLRDGGVEIELTVVGNFQSTTYAAPGVFFDRSPALKNLAEDSWISYHAYMPNSDVIKLFRRSHILLFPSIDESLGWVLVEAGLCGIPRLATNIYAFPELISHEVDGWMIDLPLNQDLRWTHLGKLSAKQGWYDAKNKIVSNMVDILGKSGITHDRLIEMGMNARNSMNALYGIDKAREDLSGIYNKAIS